MFMLKDFCILLFKNTFNIFTNFKYNCNCNFIINIKANLLQNV
jgi:hypothetical protein